VCGGPAGPDRAPRPSRGHVARRLTLSLTLALLTLSAACGLAHVAPPRSVRIATQSPLSGPYAAQGEAVRLAVALAVAQLGGVLAGDGLAVEIVNLDDRGSVEVAVDEARRVAADADVLALIGPLTSDAALAVAGIYRDGGLAMLTPSSTHPALTGRGYPNVFRLCGRDDIQADVAARFIRSSLGARTVHVVHDGTVYGEGNAGLFRAAAGRRELRVLATDVASGEGDLSRIAAVTRREAADVLYVTGAPGVAGALFKEARRIGVTAAFVGSDALDSAELLRAAGAAAKGAHYTSVAGPVPVHPQAKGFITDYRDMFGKNPEPFAAQAYDAAAIALQALAKTTHDRRPPSRDAVVAAVRATRYRGLSGPIAFDARGDLRRALYLVMKVTADDPDDWDDNREVKRFGLAPPG
jgi:branched-chain amino acid transport system substrate-binding protein